MYVYMYTNMTDQSFQVGGVKCSLCGSEGTNKTTCPLNPECHNPNPIKHPFAEKSKLTQLTHPQIQVTQENISPPPQILPTYDMNTASDDIILEVCQNLVDRKEYQALSHYLRTSKRFYQLCHKMLAAAKTTEFIFQVTQNVELASQQSHVEHPYKKRHVFLILVDDDDHHTIIDVVSFIYMTNVDEPYWMAQVEYDSKHPQQYGWKGRFRPMDVKKSKEIRNFLEGGYYAVLINQTDEQHQYQYDKLEQLVTQCRKTQRPCQLYYQLVG